MTSTVVPEAPPRPSPRREKPSASGLSAMEGVRGARVAQVARETAQAVVDGLDAWFRPSEPSVLRTFPLPFLGGPTGPATNAIRLFTAADRAYEVTVRTIAPAVGIAVLSFQASSLDNINLAAVAGVTSVPNGDFFLLPAGTVQVFRLTPNQALYARGNIGPGFVPPPGELPVSAVICSVAGGVLTAAAQGIRYPTPF